MRNPLFTLWLLFSSLIASAAGGTLIDKTLLRIPGGDNYATRAVVQPDGRMIVVGTARFGTLQFSLTRYNTDGSLDTSFASGGTMLEPLGPGNAEAWGIALQSDGKIVVAGHVRSDKDRFGIARFNADGSLDLSFGGGGAATEVGPGDSGAYAMAIQADGKIVLAGYSLGATGKKVFTLVRYNTNATLDAAFGTGGVAKAGEAAGDEVANALGFQSDGKIVAAGSGAGYLAMHRFNANGSLDGTWGLSSEPHIRDARDLVVLPDNRVAIAGTLPDGAISDLAVLRMTASGNIDGTFGPGNACATGGPCPGIAAMAVGDSAAAWGIVRQADGKYVVSGSTSLPGHAGALVIARFTEAGLADTTFGSSGRQTFYIDNDAGYGLAMRADGRFVVAGRSTTQTTLGGANLGQSYDSLAVAFTAAGALDTTFNGTGYSRLDVGSLSGAAQANVLQPDGKLVAAGIATGERHTSAAAVKAGVVARYLAGGALDTSFGTGGYTAFNWPAQAVALQGDGKIVVAGYALTNVGGTDVRSITFARYLANGTIDSGFGSGGTLTITPASGDEEIAAVEIQADGKIVGAGSKAQGVFLDSIFVRLTAAGALDATFNGSGKAVVAMSTGSDVVNALKIQADGKIVGAGWAEVSGTQDSFAVARLSSAGALDSAFGTGGVALANFGTLTSMGNALALQPDNRIVVGGQVFNTSNSTDDFAMARFNSDGTLDTSFGTAGKTTNDFGNHNRIFGLARLASGRFAAAGENGGSFGVAQYLATGVLDSTFGTAGSTTIPVNAGADYATAIAVGLDGTLYLSGDGSGLFALARVTGASAKVDPTVTLSSSLNPSQPSQAVTFTAAVGGSAGAPTGTVDFLDGATPISACSAVGIAGGSAACTTTLAAGSHSITARYSGDAIYNTATSNAVTQSVQSPPTLANIATRGQVGTGNDVLIAGFIIGGTGSKTVAVVAYGPSLASAGITNPLPNPTMTLVRASDGAVIGTNDDWQTASNSAQLQAAGFAPSHPLESAILINLPPGAYTAVISGVGGGTGVGVVGVYEVDHPEVPLINISTRGQVLTGNDVMIGGFVIQGSGPQTVAVVGYGPSLASSGIANPLANPTLTLVRSSDQTVVATNDDWGTAANASDLQARGLAPSNARESAILVTLPPGAYTAILSGVGGGTGVGIVAVYKQ